MGRNPPPLIRRTGGVQKGGVRGRRVWADRVKILIWDRTGMVLVHKRLEGCKFVWPQVRNGVMRISPAMFAALFEGLDWRLVRPEGRRRPQLAG